MSFCPQIRKLSIDEAMDHIWSFAVGSKLLGNPILISTQPDLSRTVTVATSIS